jgi:hypothetical protein
MYRLQRVCVRPDVAGDCLAVPDIGEYLVGAYIEGFCGCDIISYDHALLGEQGDIDVLGLDVRGQRAFAAEVKTHLNGLGGYGGNPGAKLREQVIRAQRFLQGSLPDWSYSYSIWSPHVTPAMLSQVGTAFNDRRLPPVDLVFNEEFAKRVNEVSVRAATDRRYRANPAYRLLQVLSRSARHGFSLGGSGEARTRGRTVPTAFDGWMVELGDRVRHRALDADPRRVGTVIGFRNRGPGQLRVRLDDGRVAEWIIPEVRFEHSDDPRAGATGGIQRTPT